MYKLAWYIFNAVALCSLCFTPLPGAAQQDARPPAVGSVWTSAVSDSQATINFNTDEPSRVQIEYHGLLVPLQTSTLNQDLALSHSVTISNLTADTEYFFMAKAIDAAGNAGYSQLESFTTTLIAPSDISLQPPSAVQAQNLREASGHIEFTLSWNDTSRGEDGFEVWQSTDGSTYTKAGTSPANSAGYLGGHFNINFGATLYYKVRSYKTVPSAATQYSAFSQPLTILGIEGPADLVAQSTSLQSVQLYWTDYSSNETGFNVERSANGGQNFESIATLVAPYQMITDRNNAQKVLYVDTGPLGGFGAGVTYTYRVSALLGTDASVPCDSATIAPNAPPVAPSLVQIVMINESTNGLTPTSVRMSWSDNSFTEKGWKVWRSIDNATWELRATIGPIVETGAGREYVDRPVLENTFYYYRVQAFNDAGASSDVTAQLRVPRRSPAGMTKWFVDTEARGNNDGSSWENAWDVRAINWFVVKPGHTVYLSGGQGAKLYPADLTIYASGSYDNAGALASPITITTGARSPVPTNHDGKVIIQGAVNFAGGSRWVTLDGAKSAAFTPRSDLSNLVANINLEVRNPFAAGVYSTAAIGNKILWSEISHSGFSLNAVDVATTYHGVWFNHQAQDSPQQAEVGYCYIHHNWQDGINSTDKITAHHNLLEWNGDDGIQGGPMIVHDNVIHYNTRGLGSTHSDGIQLMGDSFEVYNNVFSDMPNTLVRLEMLARSSGITIGHVHIYNNIFFLQKRDSTSEASLVMVGYSWPLSSFVDEATWDDVVIANNLFYNFTKSAISLSKRDSVLGKLNIKNSRIENNIILTTPNFTSGAATISAVATYAFADLKFDRNIIFGPHPAIRYGGADYARAEDLNTAASALNPSLTWSNSSLLPKFSNSALSDYHLADDDTVAIGKGNDLSTYFSFDKDNRARFHGIWDIGPFASGFHYTQPAAPANLRVH